MKNLKLFYKNPLQCEIITYNENHQDNTTTRRNKMKTETYLMNPETGSVETKEDWEAEGYTQENANLVEVEKDENGDWAEV